MLKKILPSALFEGGRGGVCKSLSKTEPGGCTPDVSRHHGGPFDSTKKSLEHHSNVTPRDLRGALNLPQSTRFRIMLNQTKFGL